MVYITFLMYITEEKTTKGWVGWMGWMDGMDGMDGWDEGGGAERGGRGAEEERASHFYKYKLPIDCPRGY